MTFLRRGNVSFPHKRSARINVNRIDGYPFQIYLGNVSCYEEHQLNPDSRITIIYFINGSNIAVRETFDEVNAACKKWQVANV